MEKKTSLYLLSGFLGAGKTTFLKNVLEDLKEHRVGVIMNEFGRIGIDGSLITKNGMELLEINRGSIFCSCLKNAFSEGMSEMADRGLEYLFVESSGLADPSNINEILATVTAEKGDVFDYRGAICLIDGLHFTEQLRDIETVERQLKHCHLAVISKTDLISPDEVEGIREEASRINDRIEILASENGKINYNFLERDLMQNRWIEGEDTLNTPENKPKTISLGCSDSVPMEAFIKFLDGAKKDCYRIKGIFFVDEKWWQVDLVNDVLDLKPTKVKLETEGSTLVFLSKIGPNVIRTVNNSWNENISVPMRLAN